MWGVESVQIKLCVGIEHKFPSNVYKEPKDFIDIQKQTVNQCEVKATVKISDGEFNKVLRTDQLPVRWQIDITVYSEGHARKGISDDKVESTKSLSLE